MLGPRHLALLPAKDFRIRSEQSCARDFSLMQAATPKPSRSPAVIAILRIRRTRIMPRVTGHYAWLRAPVMSG